jgi:hypothetical protein
MNKKYIITKNKMIKNNNKKKVKKTLYKKKKQQKKDHLKGDKKNMKIKFQYNKC